MDERIGKLHLYMGNGKGKTTAAMGLALRGLGSGMRVYVAQFLKTGDSCELAALREHKNATVEFVEPVGKFLFEMDDEEKTATRISQTAAIARIDEAIAKLKPGLMVFDELAIAMQKDMVDGDAAMRLIDLGLSLGEVVTTGRYAPQALIARADYVSEIRKIKHPYEQGLCARRGIEY